MSLSVECNTNSSTIPWKEALLALAVYILAALAVFSPVMAANGAQLLGHDQSDVWKHIWGAWWMSVEFQQGHLPTWTDLQNFPSGGRLYIIDPLNASVTAVLTPIIGLARAYNLTMVLQVLASCMTSWALASWVLKDTRASLICGMAYGFCPFMLTSGISSGIAETSNLAWLPLAMLGLLWGFTKKGGLYAVALGAAGLALSALGCWYFGMTAMIFGIALGVWVACTKSVPTPTPTAIGWAYPILACLTAGALMLPAAVFFAKSLQGDDALLAHVDVTERQESSTLEFFHKIGNFKNNADLLAFVNPGKAQLSQADDVDRRMKSVYVGLTVLLLAVLALARAGKWSFFWGISALILILLATGPYLYVAPGIGLPKPWNPVYMLAYYAIPGFRMVAISDRLAIAVQLCFAILASAGWKLIAPQKRLGTLLTVAATYFVLLETVYVSPVPWPIPTASTSMPQMVTELAQQPKRLGLIELPLNRTQTSLQPGEYYYRQTTHQKPLPITLTTRFPEQMMENQLIGTLYLCEAPKYGKPPDRRALAWGLAQLQEQGFGWISVNRQMMTPKAARKVQLALDELLGQPKAYADGILLYDLNSPEAIKSAASRSLPVVPRSRPIKAPKAPAKS